MDAGQRMVWLSSVVALAAALVSLVLVAVAVVAAGKPSRLRPAFEWARIVVLAATLTGLAVVVGIRTPAVAAGAAVALGGALGFAQGRRVLVEMHDGRLWSRRPVEGVALFGVGLFVTQLGGAARSVLAFEAGQALAVFSLAIAIGVQVGRRRTPLPPQRPVATHAHTGLPSGPRLAGGALLALLAVLAPTSGAHRIAADDPVRLLTGEIQVTLVWTGPADLDLWVLEPIDGPAISYSQPTGALGGLLDVDNNRGCRGDGSYVENVAWAEGTPTGRFAAWVNHFSCTAQTPPQSYRLEIRADGKLVLVDTGVLVYGEDSTWILFDVVVEDGRPAIVDPSGGENLDQDPEPGGDGSVATVVDAEGNVVGEEGAQDLTPEETALAAALGALATMILIGFSAQEALDALDSMGARLPAEPVVRTATPPPAPPPVADRVWERTQAKLNTKASSPPTLTEDEYISYIRKIETRFPDATPAEIVNAMHHGNHHHDIDKAMPGFEVVPEPYQWKTIPSSVEDRRGEEIWSHLERGVGSVPLTQKIAWLVPRNVTVDGVQGDIDISHAIAGLRSLQGRRHLPRLLQDLNLWTQTTGGDHWQSLLNQAWDPPEQYRGDAAGNALADFYRTPGNEQVRLSDAMRRYFDRLRAAGAAP